MRKVFSLVLLFLCSYFLYGQESSRESMLGIRVGGSAGLTYKKFLNNSFAFEAILAKDFPKKQDGVFVAGLFEKHAPLLGDKFSALLGLGPSYHFSRQSLGLYGIIGFDWRILHSPLNLQVDWSPTYYFRGSDKFSPVNAAFSIRYIINSKK